MAARTDGRVTSSFTARVLASRRRSDRSEELAQDPPGFAEAILHDLICARLRVAVCVDAELRRVSGRANVGNVAVLERDTRSVENVDSNDVIEAEPGSEYAPEGPSDAEPLSGRRLREFCRLLETSVEDTSGIEL